MKTRLRIVILSHLSDMKISGADNNKISFIQFLMLKYPDLTTEIDADQEYEEFQATRFSK